MTNARQSRTAARAKVEQMRLEQSRRQRRRTMALVVAGVFAVAALVVGITAAIRGGGGSTPSLAGVQSFTEERNHVQGPVTYPQTPPAGGNHNPVLLNCGIYTSPVPNENAVHDLEHGAVWITYRPDLAKRDVDRLTAFATGKTYLDLSPYPGLPSPVVVSAWGKQLRLTGADDTRLTAFVKRFRQGPQTLEPGAPCVGGVGSPQR